MILYIIRHADPDYANNTITPFGKLEADALAIRMEKSKPDVIYTSPLGRAIDTAAPTCRALNIGYTVLDWTAESMDYMQSPDGTKGGYTFTYTGGAENFDDYAECDRRESLDNLIRSSDAFLASLGYERAGGVYRAVKPSDSRIAVFCHGGFGCAWISWLLGTPPGTGWQKIHLRTTSVTRFTFSAPDGKPVFPVCDYLNDTSHIFMAGLGNNTR